MPRKPKPPMMMVIQRLSDGQLVSDAVDDFTGEAIKPIVLPKQELLSGSELNAIRNRKAWDHRARLLNALFNPKPIQVGTSSNKPWRRM